MLSVLSSDSDEKYIVLIFENGLSMHQQMVLEEILQEIGRANSLNEFPTKLSFDEANIRLVNYNKATKEKVGLLIPCFCESSNWDFWRIWEFWKSCWNLSNLTVCDVIGLCVPGPED